MVLVHLLYFFRQFPLVENGVLVENEQKNKSVRKALCARAGQIFIDAAKLTNPITISRKPLWIWLRMQSPWSEANMRLAGGFIKRG